MQICLLCSGSLASAGDIKDTFQCYSIGEVKKKVTYDKPSSFILHENKLKVADARNRYLQYQEQLIHIYYAINFVNA